MDDVVRDKTQPILRGVVGVGVQPGRDVGHTGGPFVDGHRGQERSVDVGQVMEGGFVDQRSEPAACRVDAAASSITRVSLEAVFVSASLHIQNPTSWMRKGYPPVPPVATSSAGPVMLW